MRILYLILIICIVITVTSIWSYSLILNYARDISQILDQINSNIQQENWQEASMSSKEMARKWSRTRSFYPIFLDHAEFHDLDISLTKINIFITLKDKKELLLELPVASRLVNHIPEQEFPGLSNIF